MLKLRQLGVVVGDKRQAVRGQMHAQWSAETPYRLPHHSITCQELGVLEGLEQTLPSEQVNDTSDGIHICAQHLQLHPGLVGVQRSIVRFLQTPEQVTPNHARQSVVVVPGCGPLKSNAELGRKVHGKLHERHERRALPAWRLTCCGTLKIVLFAGANFRAQHEATAP